MRRMTRTRAFQRTRQLSHGTGNRHDFITETQLIVLDSYSGSPASPKIWSLPRLRNGMGTYQDGRCTQRCTPRNGGGKPRYVSWIVRNLHGLLGISIICYACSLTIPGGLLGSAARRCYIGAHNLLLRCHSPYEFLRGQKGMANLYEYRKYTLQCTE